MNERIASLFDRAAARGTHADAASVFEAAVHKQEAPRGGFGTEPPRRQVPGWVAAAAAAVLVLFVVGGSTWILRGDDPEVADEPIATTVAPPVTATTERPSPSTTVPGSTTVAGPDQIDSVRLDQYTEISNDLFARTPLVRGQDAPPLEGVTISGEPFDLLDLLGKPVLVHLWYSDDTYIDSDGWVLRWDVAGIKTLEEKAGDSIEVVSVAAWGDPTNAAQIASTLGFPSTVVLPTEWDEWGLSSIDTIGTHPIWVLVDGSGRVVDGFYAMYERYAGEPNDGMSAFPAIDTLIGQLAHPDDGLLQPGDVFRSFYSPQIAVTVPAPGWRAGTISCDWHLDYLFLEYLQNPQSVLTIGPIRSDLPISEIANQVASRLPESVVAESTLLGASAIRIDATLPEAGGSFEIPGVRLGPSQPHRSTVVLFLTDRPEGKFFVSLIGSPDTFSTFQQEAMPIVATLEFPPPAAEATTTC
jgi:hypothetical protein